MTNEDNKTHLGVSPLLDFDGDAIANLIRERGWLSLDEFHRIGAAYDYVRNEIVFGYLSVWNCPSDTSQRMETNYALATCLA